MGDYADAKRSTNTTPDAAAPQRKPLPKGSDGSKPSARQPGERPRPKQSGVMFDARNVRDLVEPTTGSSKQDTFAFDPSILQFQGSSTQEVRIHNYSDEPQTIDAWELVGDVGAFTTAFVGARSVPIAPGGSVVFTVQFKSDAAVPQAAALIVRTMLSERPARLDLVGMQDVAPVEGEDAQASHGVPISATTPDGQPNPISSAIASVNGAWTSTVGAQQDGLADLKLKVRAPSKPPGWKDELLNEAIGLGLSQILGAMGLFLGGGIALAAWTVVEKNMHLGREAAAAATKKIASLTLAVHEQIVGELAQSALSKAAGAARETIDRNESSNSQIQDLFFDAQITTLSQAHTDAITSLNNRTGDYAKLEKEHPGLGFAALEAYREHLSKHLKSVVAMQRSAALGMWMSFLARLQLGTHDPSEAEHAKIGSALDRTLYQPTDAHHRLKKLADGVLEMHVIWDYDRMVDRPIFELEHVRVKGLNDELKDVLKRVPLGQFQIPIVIYGKVRRQLVELSTAGSQLGIARNEGGALWLGAKPDTDGAGMLELLGDGDPYAGARKLFAHVDQMQLTKVD